MTNTADTSSTYTIALAGNPNSGKTSVFNNITGARQHVGNYAGVTVERKEGRKTHRGCELNIVDLPGTYSLTSYSIEEVVARNFIIDEHPDVVVDVVDASNIERNLYLATQFIELGVPLVIALNMYDVANDRGIEFDLKRLSELLGAPVVPMVARSNKGTEDLLDTVLDVISGSAPGAVSDSHRSGNTESIGLTYGREIDRELDRLEQIIVEENEASALKKPRWTALKLLEDDSDVLGRISSSVVLEETARSTERLTKVFGDTPEIIIADQRYGFVSGACQEAVRDTVETRHNLSDQVDRVLANRVLGLPIFFVLMYLVFELTFTLGDPPMQALEALFGWLHQTVTTYWPLGQDSILLSLVADGIIGGVGGVIVFLPNILLLFLGIAFLEDTGYMARAAFIMDRLMHRIGLHGKSFIPMLIGFGCSVPAIMATRTLDNQRDRLTTMLIIPLMSCGARLPIYALIIPAFFPNSLHAPMLMLIYLIGILLAVISAKVLRSTLFKGESTPLVMELPPYRLPTFRAVSMHMWERAWLYVKKAGTVILGVSIVLWALSTFPQKEEFDVDYDAQRTEANVTYERAVRSLNTVVGLDESSEALLVALGQPAGQRQSVLTDHAELFLYMHDRILAVRDQFTQSAEELGMPTDAPRHLALRHEYESSLEQIQSLSPELFGAVQHYLDETLPQRDRALIAAAQAQSAEELRYTIAGRIGVAMEPLLKPMGFDWRIGTAFIGAFAAKEVFVAQLGIVYSVGEADEGSETLRRKLAQNYTPLTAFCIMLFSLVATPCVATIATTRRESNSWKWALFQLFGLTLLAWILTAAVYQVGSIVGGLL